MFTEQRCISCLLAVQKAVWKPHLVSVCFLLSQGGINWLRDTGKLKTFSEANCQTSEKLIAFWIVTLDQGAKILISQPEKRGLKISIVMISWQVLEKWKKKGPFNASCSTDKKITEDFKILKTHLKLDSQLSSTSWRLNQFKLQINEKKWLLVHSV